MQNFSQKIDKNLFKELENRYKEYEEPSHNQYIYKSYKTKDFTVNLYTSGTYHLFGANILNEKKFMSMLLNKNMNTSIGSDEVGTGDIFGPIVICSVYLTDEFMEKLSSYNINDSKTLNDTEIIKIAEKFLPEIPHSALVLDNEKYNQIVKTNNMNMIKAKMHNSAIINLKEKLNDVEDKIEVILDQFCEKNIYFKYLLNEKRVYKNIDFRTKAESYSLSVAMASIFARYIFLKKFEEMEEKYHLNLTKGASTSAINKVIEINEKLGQDIFLKIAKTNFKTFEKLGIFFH